jgi:hypothetical protein
VPVDRVKGDNLLQKKIQWHPAFCSAAELEFRADREALEFQPEKNLSRKPLQVDLVIRKKEADVALANELGRFFNTYNIVEYKSPKDGLNIDDYYKTVAYACLFKGHGHTVNKIKADEITISLVQDAYPRELMRSFREQGLQIVKSYPGIYYILGNVIFATQLVVISQLAEEHTWLRALTDKLKEADANRFLQAAQRLTMQGEMDCADSVMAVSFAANKAIYQEIRKENAMAWEALRELMKEDLKEDLDRALDQGISQGLVRGSIEAWEDVDLSEEDILARLQKKFQLDEATAEEYYAQYTTRAVV